MTKKQTFWLLSSSFAVYLAIATVLAVMLHDKMPVAVIAVINYAVAAAVLSPAFMILSANRKEQGK